MHGAVVFVRSVVEQRNVICAEDGFLLADDLLQFLRDLSILPLADDIVQRFDHHLDARLDNEARNDHTDVGFQRHAPNEIDDRRGKHRSGQNRVEHGVGARGSERAGVDLLALLLHIQTEQELHDDRHGNDDERDRAVVRCFRMEDLFDRFDQRRDARIQHQRGDDHGT